MRPLLPLLLIAACAAADLQPGLVAEVRAIPAEGLADEPWPDAPGLGPAKAHLDARPFVWSGYRSGATRFCVRWSGVLRAEVPGETVLLLVSDDGARLRLGDTVVIDNSGFHGAVLKTARVPLAGDTPLTIDYYQGDGGCALALAWAQPGRPLELVPPSALLHDATQPAHDDGWDPEPEHLAQALELVRGQWLIALREELLAKPAYADLRRRRDEAKREYDLAERMLAEALAADPDLQAAQGR